MHGTAAEMEMNAKQLFLTREQIRWFTSNFSKSYGNVIGNFTGASGNIESASICRAIQKLQHINFGGYAHVKDGETRVPTLSCLTLQYFKIKLEN